VQVIATISTGVVEVNANSGTVFGCYSTVKEALKIMMEPSRRYITN
jgi:hypothetical protein